MKLYIKIPFASQPLQLYSVNNSKDDNDTDTLLSILVNTHEINLHKYIQVFLYLTSYKYIIKTFAWNHHRQQIYPKASLKHRRSYICTNSNICLSHISSVRSQTWYIILKRNTIHMYSGITSGRVLDGELLCTKILEVNLFAFAYWLFHSETVCRQMQTN